MPGLHRCCQLIILMFLATQMTSASTNIDVEDSFIQNKDDKEEIICLANNIYFEAKGESIKGQYAVASVTINRTRHKNFPSSICNVVKQKSQFTWVSSNRNKIYNHKKYLEILDLAKQIYYAEEYKDNTRGSLYFHEKTIEPPNWSSTKIKTTMIGNHVFYK